MRSRLQLGLSAMAIFLGGTLAVRAAGYDPGKYPLRIFIFRYASRATPGREPKHPQDMDAYVSGMGQADLFENGVPTGFQFTYNCMVDMRSSVSYETFPARWKKKGKTLEILLPELKKAENVDTCDLQADFTPGKAYIWKDGGVAAEPSEKLKAWMGKHQFDPENGAEEPMLRAGDRETETSDPMRAPE